MPEPSEEVESEARFQLVLGGARNGLEPASLSAFAGRTASLAERMAQFIDPELQISVRVVEARRGSFILVLALRALDDLARASPTLHVGAMGLIGLALNAYFKFIVAEVKRARRLELDSLDDTGQHSPEGLARQAAADDTFKERMSDLIEVAKDNPEVESLALSVGAASDAATIPAGYYLDVQRRLLVPTDITTRLVKLEKHHIFLDKPIGHLFGPWRVIWWEGEERVDVVAEIGTARLKTFLSTKFDPEYRQIVADVEFTESLNRRTKDRIVSNVTIRRVHVLPRGLRNKKLLSVRTLVAPPATFEKFLAKNKLTDQSRTDDDDKD